MSFKAAPGQAPPTPLRLGRLVRKATSHSEPAAVTAETHALGEERRLEGGSTRVAEHLALSAFQGRALAEQRDTVVALARALAERLVGDALATDDRALGNFAASLLDEARGARRLAVHVHPEQAARLEAALALHDFDERDVRVIGDQSCAFGSLRVETEFGSIEGSIAEGLVRLAAIVRDRLEHGPLEQDRPKS